MFEAEGQLNLMMADSSTLTTEEEYLRGIWNNLGVGKNGYISMKELEEVCRHIGMEEMSPSVSYCQVIAKELEGLHSAVGRAPDS